MALDKATLKEAIREILKDADLNSMSSKKVRLQLEKKFETDLMEQKKMIDSLVMELITKSKQKEKSEDEDDNAENGEFENSESEEGNESDSGKDEDYKPNPAVAKRGRAVKSVKSNASASQKKPKKKYADSDESESEDDDEKDEDYKANKPTKKRTSQPKKKEKEEGATPKKRGGSTYSRKCLLSSELADVVGAPEMARHDVVKKMWQIVKERNLYDPSNKQFAICDEQLHKVFGVKRFRTFGMMKYLKSHIKDQK